MGMELGRGVAVDRPGAVVLELRGRPFACGFGGMVAADARLDVALELIHCNPDALAMRFPDALVASHESRERNALRRAERRIPSGAVLHGSDCFAAFVFVLECLTVADYGLARFRVLAVGEAHKMLFRDLANKPPFGGEPALPLTEHVALGVVALLGRGELAPVIAFRLAGAKRPGDGEHCSPPLSQRWAGRRKQRAKAVRSLPAAVWVRSRGSVSG